MGVETGLALLGGLAATAGSTLLTKKPKAPEIKPPPQADMTAPARAVDAQKDIMRKRQGLAANIIAGETAQAQTQTASALLRGTLG